MLALLALAAVPATPPAPRLEFVLEELVLLGAATDVGETPYGRRNIVPIVGGTFEGPKLRGTIVPGGWDWQLGTKGGCTRLTADYMIRTDDGVTINVRNQGALCPGADALTTPSFEAPLGRYAWLNAGAFVGTLQVTEAAGKPAVRLRFYRARSGAQPGAPGQ